MWVRTSSKSGHHLPRPYDEPLVEAPGPHALRVLLFGSALALGYGVHSHQLGLGGELARQLRNLTGRGFTVEIYGVPDMSVRQATRHAKRMDLERFDVVVTTLGTHEVLTLAPPDRWERTIDRLFTTLTDGGRPSLRIFAVSIVPMAALLDLPAAMRTLISRRTAELNELLWRACIRANCSLVPFEPQPMDAVNHVGHSAYAEWTGLIAPTIARGLAPIEPDPAT